MSHRRRGFGCGRGATERHSFPRTSSSCCQSREFLDKQLWIANGISYKRRKTKRTPVMPHGSPIDSQSLGMRRATALVVRDRLRSVSKEPPAGRVDDTLGSLRGSTSSGTSAAASFS